MGKRRKRSSPGASKTAKRTKQITPENVLKAQNPVCINLGVQTQDPELVATKVSELVDLSEVIPLPPCSPNTRNSLPEQNSFEASNRRSLLDHNAEEIGSMEHNEQNYPSRAESNLMFVEQVEKDNSDLCAELSFVSAKTLTLILDRFKFLEVRLENLASSIQFLSKITESCSKPATETGNVRENLPPTSEQREKNKVTQWESPIVQRRKRGQESICFARRQRQKQGNSYVLQRGQIYLDIAKIQVNFRKWNSRNRIMLSLSQLLSRPINSIDLMKVEWLPSDERNKRVLLAFKTEQIITELFKLRHYLSKYGIAPKRVFKNLTVQALIEEQHHARKCAVEQKRSSSFTQVCGGEELMSHAVSLEREDNADLAETLEDLEEKAYEEFGQLSEGIQGEILHKVTRLWHTLSSIHSIKKSTAKENILLGKADASSSVLMDCSEVPPSQTILSEIRTDNSLNQKVHTRSSNNQDDLVKFGVLLKPTLYKKDLNKQTKSIVQDDQPTLIHTSLSSTKISSPVMIKHKGKIPSLCNDIIQAFDPLTATDSLTNNNQNLPEVSSRQIAPHQIQVMALVHATPSESQATECS